MINPENDKNQKNKNSEDKKKTAGYTGPSDRDDNLDSGDTSSVADLDKSSFTRKPSRTNKPMGASHEPGTLPGRD